MKKLSQKLVKLLIKKTKSELETICREKGIISKGNKLDIIKRLL